MRSGRNNVLAGTLVLASIIGALVIVILLAGGLERFGKRAYSVRFTLDEGVSGLEEGSKVYVGGQPVGVVTGQEFERSASDQVDGILVTINVQKSVVLREAAVAQLITPLLGGSASINFPSVGAGRELTPTDQIDGMIAPPGLLAQAGYGPEQADQVKRVIKRVDDITAKIDSMSSDAQGLLTDARTVVSDVKDRSPQWMDRIDSITKNVDETAERGPEIARSLEDRLETVRQLIDENRENIKETLANARSASGKADQFLDRLNNELADLARAFLEDGRTAMANGSEALERANTLLGEQSPNIRRSLANFRLASDELTAMMNEVRRSPWRLLYRPDKREMDFELLYDSARAYAGAVSNLRAASETVQAIASGSGDSSKLSEMMVELESSFERYKSAEAEFLRQISLRAE